MWIYNDKSHAEEIDGQIWIVDNETEEKIIKIDDMKDMKTEVKVEIINGNPEVVAFRLDQPKIQ